MDAEAGHSQPPENLSLKGGWFRRPLPRSFPPSAVLLWRTGLRGHRASAVPLHALRPIGHDQAARQHNESDSPSVYMREESFIMLWSWATWRPRAAAVVGRCLRRKWGVAFWERQGL